MNRYRVMYKMASWNKGYAHQFAEWVDANSACEAEAIVKTWHDNAFDVQAEAVR